MDDHQLLRYSRHILLPEIGIGTSLLGQHYILSACLWSFAFAIWLVGFVPLLKHPLDEADAAQPV